MKINKQVNVLQHLPRSSNSPEQEMDNNNIEPPLTGLWSYFLRGKLQLVVSVSENWDVTTMSRERETAACTREKDG